MATDVTDKMLNCFRHWHNKFTQTEHSKQVAIWISWGMLKTNYSLVHSATISKKKKHTPHFTTTLATFTTQTVQQMFLEIVIGSWFHIHRYALTSHYQQQWIPTWYWASVLEDLHVFFERFLTYFLLLAELLLLIHSPPINFSFELFCQVLWNIRTLNSKFFSCTIRKPRCVTWGICNWVEVETVVSIKKHWNWKCWGLRRLLRCLPRFMYGEN